MADAGHTPGHTDFDVLILGAGSGGYACALRAAQLGLKVGLVEKDKVGGTCLHVGCIPTKALLHAAEVADSARDSERFGVRASLEGIDMAGVNAYKDGVVARLFKGLSGLIKGRGITVIEGAGTMTGPREVTVDGTAYTGAHLVLASGSYSRSLPGLEVDGEKVLTSEHALRLERVPSSVVVLGGGVIGSEFASVWRSFGADVTIVEALPRLVAAEDAASSKALERAFRKRGIAFRTSTRFSSVEHTDSGVAVTVEIAGADHIAGREPADWTRFEQPAIARVNMHKILLRPMPAIGREHIEIAVAVDIGQCNLGRELRRKFEQQQRVDPKIAILRLRSGRTERGNRGKQHEPHPYRPFGAPGAQVTDAA